MPERPQILLVDDDPLIRSLGRELLEHLGYRVATAGDGGEAVRLFQELNGVDMVILDYHLPGQDGLEVMGALRGLDGAARVLLASGSFSPGEVVRFQAAGASGLIHKPYRTAELQSRIQEVLAGTPAF